MRAWRPHAQFDSAIVEDIFEMRLRLEPRASFLAMRHGKEETFQIIERRYLELAAAYGQSAKQAASDIRATGSSAARSRLDAKSEPVVECRVGRLSRGMPDV